MYTNNIVFLCDEREKRRKKVEVLNEEINTPVPRSEIVYASYLAEAYNLKRFRERIHEEI